MNGLEPILAPMETQAWERSAFAGGVDPLLLMEDPARALCDRLLPLLGDKLQFLFKPLFGFTSSECVSVPITALGSAGASLGMVPELLREGAAGANDIAVFTGMCMCWSGYLSTHVSMMDMLRCNELVGKSILSHTIGGFCAGIAAHWLFVLFSLI